MASVCFSTSDPAAVNATKLYDYNNDEEDLWSRRSQLPLCSSSLFRAEFPCLVCLQVVVYAVCRNLTDRVKVVMEGVGVQINIVKSECPRLLSDEVHTGQLSGIVVFLIILMSVIIGVIWYKFRRLSTGPQQQRGSGLQVNDQTEPPEQVLMLNGGHHIVQPD